MLGNGNRAKYTKNTYTILTLLRTGTYTNTYTKTYT